MSGRVMHPVALILGSVAYLYSTISNVGVIPSRHSPVFAETNYGTVRGLKAVSRNSRNYFEFRGIPYAKPPIDHLRFEPPERPENWTGIRDAVSYGSRCWQLEFVTRRLQGNEDCLFLNVYTHQVMKKREVLKERLNPVLVYIHGGLFMSGVSNSYRPKYFMEEDVVLVTINYRLASFGFLNTGDSVVRGNMGLKDQTLALKWVQENIEYFGGDPQLVTIVGESAGGASVHLHMLTPLSKGLFSRAISQSGTAMSRWLPKHPQKQARTLGKRVGCPTNSSIEMVACLKAKSARSIARTHHTYVKDLLRGKFSTFGPTIEAVNDSTTFLAEKPVELLRQGKLVSRVPWINGVNSEEGLIYVVGVIRNGTRLAKLNDNWFTYAPTIFDYEEHPERDNISARIKEYYLGKHRLIGMNTLEESVNMFSDRSFFEDSHDAAVLQSKMAPVYSYYYTFKGDFALANILFAMSGALPETIDFVVGNTLRWISSKILRREQRHYGVCHSDELAVFYNLPVVAREIVPGSPDYAFSKSLIKLWASFALKGKPGSVHGVTWEAVSPKAIIEENVEAENSLSVNKTSGSGSGLFSIRRLEISKEPEMIDEPFLDRLKFWKSLQLED